jgi:LytS/YehU family sensor histidine kinase
VISSFEGDASGKIISPLLLIPFVENCFKHGISISTSGNKIEISVHIEGDRLRMKTCNQLVPERKGSIKKSGTGIENVKKRLQLLYADKHQLEITKDEHKYVVDLLIEI